MSTAEALLHSLRQQTKTGHTHSDEPDSLPNRYLRIRQQSLKLCQELEIEDFELQAADFQPYKMAPCSYQLVFRNIHLKKHL